MSRECIDTSGLNLERVFCLHNLDDSAYRMTAFDSDWTSSLLTSPVPVTIIRSPLINRRELVPPITWYIIRSYQVSGRIASGTELPY